DGEFSWEDKRNRRLLRVRLSMVPAKLAKSEYPLPAFVLRLLGYEKTLSDINNLGMGMAQTSLFKRALSHPSGLIVVTGPTGSGKSTTLYAALRYLRFNRPNW